jgi:3-phenylpropionate/trans-cinnamate dioxygenase ferredoxin reductase subunit
MKTVIIGGSHAAIAAATELRRLSADAEITIISADHEFPYQRPPLSKGYMSGKVTFDQIVLKAPDWYAANKIDLRRSTTVRAIGRARSVVVTTEGEDIAYDRLVIATGSMARRLPAVSGGHLSNVHVMRDHGDAMALMARMHHGAKLVVIGGGYIGLEAASEAAKKEVSVTVIEATDRILKRVACPQTADDIRALHVSHGVTIRENTQIARISETSGLATGVELADGTIIAADFIITGIGVLPETGLAEAAGLAIENGISVNQRLETSDPNIFAIGDCASFVYRGQRIRLESVQNAHDMGLVVAENILGGRHDYHPVPWFWSDQFELKLQIAGLNMGYDKIITRMGAREGAKSHFYFAGETFLAADCLNDAATYMVSRKILEGGKVLTPAQVGDPAFVLKSLLA